MKNLFRDDPLPSLVEKNPAPTPDPKAQRVEATIARVRALNGKRLKCDFLSVSLDTPTRRRRVMDAPELAVYAEHGVKCRLCDVEFYLLEVRLFEEKASRVKADGYVPCEHNGYTACPHCGVFLREEDDAEHGDLFKVLEKLEAQYAPTRVSAGMLHSAEQRVERRRLEIALAEERHREAVAELEKLRELPVDLESYRTPSTPSST